MYRKLPGSHDDVLGYEVTGRVSEDEYLEIVTEVQETIDEYGDARVLARMPRVPNASYLGEFAERLRYAQQNGGKVERYAVVSDDPKTEWISWLADQVMPIQVRHFPEIEEPEAWQWVSAHPG